MVSVGVEDEDEDEDEDDKMRRGSHIQVLNESMFIKAMFKERKNIVGPA